MQGAAITCLQKAENRAYREAENSWDSRFPIPRKSLHAVNLNAPPAMARRSPPRPTL